MRGKTNSVIVTGGSTENTLKKLLDTTKSTSYLFKNYTGASVDDLIQPNDTENVTNMSNMFDVCKNLTSIPQLNTSNVTNMSGMFRSCTSLINIPLLDTSKVTIMASMFYGCTSLTSIPALDVSNVTNFSSVFANCEKLSSIHMTGAKKSFNISASTYFTAEDLQEIINNLGTVTTTQTLTMGATNLSKVSEEYVTIATNKGWTLA